MLKTINNFNCPLQNSRHSPRGIWASLSWPAGIVVMSCEALNPSVLPRRSCVTSGAEEGVAPAFQMGTGRADEVD